MTSPTAARVMVLRSAALMSFEPVPTAVTSPPRRASRWLRVVAALVMVPAVVCGVVVVVVGLRMRSAATRTREFCADHPTGERTDVADIERYARAKGLVVNSGATGSGGVRVEARSGVLTASYVCAIELREGRVTSSGVTQED